MARADLPGRSAQTPDAFSFMSNRVLASLENPWGHQCVDIFVRENGTFGFEEFRRDPEDGGLWQCLNSYSGLVYASEAQAVAAARESVLWLAKV